MKYILFITLLVTFSCCQNTSPLPEKKYFSIHDFLVSEIHRLKNDKTTLIKTIRQNNKSETVKLNLPDWENELKPFFEADIDKPAWKNTYSCDSAVNDSGSNVMYQALHPKAPVRQLQITYLENQIATVVISFEKSNSWFTLKQELIYWSGKGYSIKSNQKMSLSDPASYEINATFHPVTTN